MKVEVLFFKGCPNHLPTVERVRETLNTMGLHEEVHEIEVDSQDKAEATAFLGSPSVRINGVDIEPSARDARAFGLICRTYIDGATRTGAAVSSTDSPEPLPSRLAVTRRTLSRIQESCNRKKKRQTARVRLPYLQEEVQQFWHQPAALVLWSWFLWESVARGLEIWPFWNHIGRFL